MCWSWRWIMKELVKSPEISGLLISQADEQFSALSSKKGKEPLVEFSSASLDDTSLRAAMGGKSIAPMNTSRWNEQLSCLCMNIKAEQQLDL
ncbi:hypothetical protein HPP92_019945 [Vanilla planifolia]|uniref:Uncharacterized protein n=1 Tax=Vanilla planifolia TaxID=51239 RepID=A0A835Q484_VANPL|nr:hypothetical protein HPP92_019945 [Vanilla planifolia]